jgi:hypothetical protein
MRTSVGPSSTPASNSRSAIGSASAAMTRATTELTAIRHHHAVANTSRRCASSSSSKKKRKNALTMPSLATTPTARTSASTSSTRP